MVLSRNWYKCTATLTHTSHINFYLYYHHHHAVLASSTTVTTSLLPAHHFLLREISQSVWDHSSLAYYYLFCFHSLLHYHFTQCFFNLSDCASILISLNRTGWSELKCAQQNNNLILLALFLSTLVYKLLQIETSHLRGIDGATFGHCFHLISDHLGKPTKTAIFARLKSVDDTTTTTAK